MSRDVANEFVHQIFATVQLVSSKIFTSGFLKKHGTPEKIEGNTYDGEDVECLVIDFPDYTGNLAVEANNGIVGMHASVQD